MSFAMPGGLNIWPYSKGYTCHRDVKLSPTFHSSVRGKHGRYRQAAILNAHPLKRGIKIKIIICPNNWPAVSIVRQGWPKLLQLKDDSCQNCAPCSQRGLYNTLLLCLAGPVIKHQFNPIKSNLFVTQKVTKAHADSWWHWQQIRRWLNYCLLPRQTWRKLIPILQLIKSTSTLIFHHRKPRKHISADRSGG